MNANVVYDFLVGAWSLAAKAWVGIGPLIGVFIGSWLSRSWQGKQWVLDNKRNEYRELISGLSKSYRDISKNWVGVMSGEQEREINEAKFAGWRVIEDRLFIAQRTQAERIYEQWSLLAAETDYRRFVEYWRSLHAALVKMAHDDLGINESLK